MYTRVYVKIDLRARDKVAAKILRLCAKHDDNPTKSDGYETDFLNFLCPVPNGASASSLTFYSNALKVWMINHCHQYCILSVIEKNTFHIDQSTIICIPTSLNNTTELDFESTLSKVVFEIIPFFSRRWDTIND